MITAILNDSYPGATPAGTEVEVEHVRGQLFIKVGRHTVKVSPRWLDTVKAPVLRRVGVRTKGGML